MSAAVGLAVDVTAAIAQRATAHRAKVRNARDQVHAIAMHLAEDGLSAETIREAMADMATTASDRAAAYIREYDEAEERRCAIDREDPAEEATAEELAE